MAQNRKATDDDVRIALREAVRAASKEFAAASEAYEKKGSIANLRAVQVAMDRLAALNAEIRRFDGDRSVEETRKADANPRRAKASWPAGAPEKPKKPRLKPKPERVLPPLPPPPPPRPPVLNTQVLKDRKPEGERVSWWVGRDRSALDEGAEALKTRPPGKTERPASRTAVKKTQQELNDAKRDARAAGPATVTVSPKALAKRERLAKEFNEKLKPTAGAFSVVPPVQ